MARATESTDPSTISVENWRDSPSLMNLPKPPSPTSAVTVTSPMVVTVAIRNPAMIAGVASGRSTRRIRRHRS